MSDHDHFAGELTIDDEFAKLLTALTDEENQALEASLLDEGCREPLLAWQVDGKTILVDGHNRRRICAEAGIGYRVKLVKFADRAAAMNWIINNQLARRNLDEKQKAAYLRGKQYTGEKKTRGGDRKSKPQFAGLIEKSTADRLGEEHGVSADTIVRNEVFAQAVDKLAEADPEAKKNILAGDVRLPADAASAVLEMEPTEVAEVAKAVATKSVKKVTAKPKKAAKALPPEVAARVAREEQDDAEMAALSAPYKEAIAALNLIGRTFKALADDPGHMGHVGIPWGRIRKALNDAKTPIAQARPAGWCHQCKGKKCDSCRQTGWLPKSVFDAMNCDEKGKVLWTMKERS